MLEKNLESYFTREVEREGYLTLKFLSTVRGVPDRILFGQGRVYLVELKNGSRGRLSKLQEYVFSRFDSLGFPVAVLRTREEVDCFVHSLPSL